MEKNYIQALLEDVAGVQMIWLRSVSKGGWYESKIRKLALEMSDFFWESSPGVLESIEVILAAKLYGRLENWYAKKEKIAFSKTHGLPWASLSTMCRLMGFRDHIKSRYLMMELKQALDKAFLVYFWKQFKKGLKLADKFFLLEKPTPKVQNFPDLQTSTRYCHVYVVQEDEFLDPPNSRSLVAF